MSTFPATLTVDGTRYQIDHSLGGLPQVWVHRRRSEPAVHYFTGRSLVEGSARENAEYLRKLIRSANAR